MTAMAFGRWAGPPAVAGGLLWVVLRPLVATTWKNPTLGLTYEDYNRLMVAPLALLLLGALALHARYATRTSGWARRGLLATVLGFPLMLLGVVLEFYVAGGVNTGDWAGSLVGWMVFLLGHAASAGGLVVFGVAARREALLGRWSGLPLATGVVGLLWPFLAEVRIVLNVLIQVLFGLGWIALGYLLWSERDQQHAAEPRGRRPSRGCPEAG